VTPSTTAQPSASVQPSPSASGGGTTVALTASPTLKFDQTQLNAPAGAPFTITFDNQDAGQVHNVEIKDQAGATLFRGDTVTGPGQISYQVPALAAGSYPFNCTVHPAMTGTITAG
jgi:plastocyanin